MNLISKVQNSLERNQSIAGIVNDDNICTVIDMAARRFGGQKTIEQLERKTCKVSLESRLHAIMHCLPHNWTEYLFTKNTLGERSITDSVLVDMYFDMIKKKGGLEGLVTVMANWTDSDVILGYLLNRGFGEELQWYADNMKLPNPDSIGNNEVYTNHLCCANEMSVVVRKYLASLDN